MNRFQIQLTLLVSFILVTSFFGCSKSTLEINVTDFAAVPNDSKDDTPAILLAIEAGALRIMNFCVRAYRDYAIKLY